MCNVFCLTAQVWEAGTAMFDLDLCSQGCACFCSRMLLWRRLLHCYTPPKKDEKNQWIKTIEKKKTNLRDTSDFPSVYAHQSILWVGGFCCCFLDLQQVRWRPLPQKMNALPNLVHNLHNAEWIWAMWLTWFEWLSKFSSVSDSSHSFLMVQQVLQFECAPELERLNKRHSVLLPGVNRCYIDLL